MSQKKVTSTTDPEFWTILKTPPKPIYGNWEHSLELEEELARILREEIDKEIIARIIKANNES
jgi:hypothetical protein